MAAVRNAAGKNDGCAHLKGQRGPFQPPRWGMGRRRRRGASAAEAALPDELLPLAPELAAADLVTDASVEDLFGLASPPVVSERLVSCMCLV